MDTEAPYILFYGSLLQPEIREDLDIESSVEYMEETSIPGKLLDLGEYPGYVPDGESLVYCQIFKITDFNCLQLLDDYEGYFPDDQERSLYIRKRIKIPGSKITAWIYEYAGSREGKNVIGDGKWS